MGVTMPPGELSVAIAIASGYTPAEAARILKRPINSVEACINNFEWTTEREEKLRFVWSATHSDISVADALGVSPRMAADARRSLGIRGPRKRRKKPG
jgi:hypothetical protein